MVLLATAPRAAACLYSVSFFLPGRPSLFCVGSHDMPWCQVAVVRWHSRLCRQRDVPAFHPRGRTRLPKHFVAAAGAACVHERSPVAAAEAGAVVGSVLPSLSVNSGTRQICSASPAVEGSYRGGGASPARLRPSTQQPLHTTLTDVADSATGAHAASGSHRGCGAHYPPARRSRQRPVSGSYSSTSVPMGGAASSSHHNRC